MPDLFDITHGAGGLWEKLKWNNSLELNTAATSSAARYHVTKITGLNALPDLSDNSTKKVGRIGQNFYPASFDGKTVTIEGELTAPTVPALRLARTTMLAAFGDTTAEGYMDLIPQAGDSSPTGRFFAKPLALELPEEITQERPLRTFLLALRLTDPRTYFPSLAVDSSSIYPLAVTNPGVQIDPTITVSSASGTVTVSNGTKTLTFRNCPAGSLVIDFYHRTAKVGSTPVELVTASSDWWDSHVPGIAGGATVTITQTGGTGVRVQFTPAVWG